VQAQPVQPFLGPLVRLPNAQDDATARVLAPRKEAFDTPLSPPPLNDEPGPATGRSGAYPDGTFTRRPGPASRTQHDPKVRACLADSFGRADRPGIQAARIHAARIHAARIHAARIHAARIHAARIHAD